MHTMNFSTAAEEMHAGAFDYEQARRFEREFAEIYEGECKRDEEREAMEEARGNDGVTRPFPPAYGSLDSQDAAFAHYVLTGGE